MSASALLASRLRGPGSKAAPVAIVALAAAAARSPAAAHHPRAALLLFLWIVADTMVLSLIVRSHPRRPRAAEVIAALAAAAVTVAAGAPAVLRQALLSMPLLVAAFAIVLLVHGVGGAIRARRVLATSRAPRGARWIAAASEVLPHALVRFAAAEAALLHMALFRWGGPADVPHGSRAFAYHRHLAPMCAVLLGLSLIEAGVCHLLVAQWSRSAALAMFVVSDVGLVYLVGLIKSFRFRPVLVTSDAVRIRAGILIDQPLPLDNIAGIETRFTGADVHDAATLNAALLAWPNVLLRLRAPLVRRRLLRRQRVSAVAFRLDDADAFVRHLQDRLDALARQPG